MPASSLTIGMMLLQSPSVVTARDFAFSPHASLNNFICRGSGSSVTTCSPPLSCRSISLFSFVTCLSSFAHHPVLLVSPRSSHVPTPSEFRQASFLHPRTPDHCRVSTGGCLAHDGSTNMVMTIQCRTPHSSFTGCIAPDTSQGFC